MVVKMGTRCWDTEYALPRHMDNTTDELLLQGVGHYMARRALEAGASSCELVYDAQAADILAKKRAEKVKNPLRRAVVEAMDASLAECWWILSHQTTDERLRSCPERRGGNEAADEVADRAAL